VEDSIQGATDIDVFFFFLCNVAQLQPICLASLLSPLTMSWINDCMWDPSTIVLLNTIYVKSLNPMDLLILSTFIKVKKRTGNLVEQPTNTSIIDQVTGLSKGYAFIQ
jgi:hypothetical protein